MIERASHGLGFQGTRIAFDGLGVFHLFAHMTKAVSRGQIVQVLGEEPNVVSLYWRESLAMFCRHNTLQSCKLY